MQYVVKLKSKATPGPQHDPFHYCKRDASHSNTSGIDRMDNTKGYLTSNIVACCSECNAMKVQLPMQSFINACAQVARHVDVSTLPEMPVCLKVITKRANVNNI